MASPDTKILLIVDYHAAIGAAPLPSPPKKKKNLIVIVAILITKNVINICRQLFELSC